MENKKSMFDIIMDYNNLLDEVEALDGELTPETEELMIKTQEEFEYKLRGYKEFNNFIKFKTEDLKLKIKKFQTNNKTLENRRKRLLEYVTFGLRTFGNINPKTGTIGYKADDFSVWLKNTEALNINDDYVNYNYEDLAIIVKIYNSNNERENVAKFNWELLELCKKYNYTIDSTVKSLNNTALKLDIEAKVYKCDNSECKAYKTHFYDDCTCTDKPSIKQNTTPVFR